MNIDTAVNYLEQYINGQVNEIPDDQLKEAVEVGLWSLYKTIKCVEMYHAKLRIYQRIRSQKRKGWKKEQSYLIDSIGDIGYLIGKTVPEVEQDLRRYEHE